MGTTLVATHCADKVCRAFQLAERFIRGSTSKGFVSGHDFSRAISGSKQCWALAPAGLPPNSHQGHPFFATCLAPAKPQACLLPSKRPIQLAASPFRPESKSPIQQLTGHVSNHEIQYQCGHGLLQLGRVAPKPITSPITKNQSTCRAARLGANRAQTHAQRMDTSTKNAVLAISARFEGTFPFANSPGKISDSNGSVANTRTTDSM